MTLRFRLRTDAALVLSRYFLLYSGLNRRSSPQPLLQSRSQLLQSYAAPSATKVEHLASTFNEMEEDKPEASPSISSEI